MTLRIDRRSLVLTGMFGIGALAIPGFAGTLLIADARGFTHSVASGEPGADNMLFWTRYVPADGGAAKLRLEVSATPDFARIAGGGEILTGPWRDHTAKIVAHGLRPGTRYFFRFVAPDGSFSPVGRTKTLPDGPARRFGIAVFSCSNMGFGYFNAYGHAARRDDIDLALHTGDYIYEYQHGTYPSEAKAIASRLPQPATECLHLADYRLRYASYRSDPDLQALHAMKPMIVQWDDHETANNSWEGGAQNHGKDEGDWNTRRDAAAQAFREWMPVSEAPWGSYDIGGLATLFRTEGRLHRTPAPDLGPLFMRPDPAKDLAAFRDGAWQDPAASLLGSEQEQWLYRGLRESVRAGRRWQVTAFGTIMGQQYAPEAMTTWLPPGASGLTRAYIQSGVAAGKLGLPADLDNWSGYPAARARFLKAGQEADAELVVLCGDSHNAWAYTLEQDGKPAAREFAGQSVSSPGYEDFFSTVDPKTTAAALIARNPELKWCDTSNRGYMALTLTPTQVTNDWVFVDTVRAPSMAARVGHSVTLGRGRYL